MPNWKGTLNNTASLYYQGMSASQAQVTRYLDNPNMQLTTGEVGSLETAGITTIPRSQLWVYPEVPEANRHTEWGWMGKFEHWIRNIQIKPNQHVALDYTPLYPCDESGTLHHYSIDASKCSLGQSTDIAAHEAKYTSLMNLHPEINQVILYGVSRGAATTFSAMAEKHYAHVKLCILEAAPSSISGILKHYFHKPVATTVYQLASKFLGAQHSTDKASQARGHVDSFPDNVPVVFVSSLSDGVVPIENSLRLALRLAAKRIQGQERESQPAAPVYFLKLNDVGHNDYATSGKAESARYNQFIHAVYKKHELPHDEVLAKQGESELITADLTSRHHRAMLDEQIVFWADRTHRPEIRVNALAKLIEQQHDLPSTKDELDVYAQMPLFSKHLEGRFFSKTEAQSNIESLKNDVAHQKTL